jgi:hypothetical protein
MYFSISTLLTVGYGDIVASNIYEIYAVNFILLIGVCTFSFILSKTSNLFWELS